MPCAYRTVLSAVIYGGIGIRHRQEHQGVLRRSPALPREVIAQLSHPEPHSKQATYYQLTQTTHVLESLLTQSQSTKVVRKSDRFNLMTCPRCDKPINKARLVEPLVRVSQLIQDRFRPSAVHIACSTIDRVNT